MELTELLFLFQQNIRTYICIPTKPGTFNPLMGMYGPGQKYVRMARMPCAGSEGFSQEIFPF